jgi:hypothetical protein
VGNTEEDPAPNLIDMKIKSHIKTGMFGNGHPRTKAHFSVSMELADMSFKHKISGPTPGPNNAFIWIGHLKNNGYMDLLDRPNDKGRETIIYAPATLDLDAPVEIKYYFHGVGGFGYAHLNGPNSSTVEAEANAELTGNDFREKIAPAIKDLNIDGRNYILVIPEMAYSLGFGTATGNVKRINKLIEGEKVNPGIFPGNETANIRALVDNKSRDSLKNYLSAIQIESTKNLLQNTPLRQRQLATFDGSYTGGDFGLFHYEILDVLDKYIYNGSMDVEFISFVTDGLGSIALASIVQPVEDNPVHTNSAKSFRSAIVGMPDIGLRIDFITSPEAEEVPSLYGSYFGLSSPSEVVFNQILQYREDIAYTEFNYITPSTTKDSDNSFFNNLGKIEDYKKNVVSPGHGASANKFSFLLGLSETDRRFASLHVIDRPSVIGTKNKVGYAFSMVNNFLPSSQKPPKKNNTNSHLKPGYNKVPDHAYALAAKPTPSDLEKLAKQRDELVAQIAFFKVAIDKISGPSLGEGFVTLCNDPKYKIYCNENNIVDQNDNSLFSTHYRKYLNNIKKDAEISILLEKGAYIEQIRSSKAALEIEKFTLEEKLGEAKDKLNKGAHLGESFRDTWNLLNTGIAEFNDLPDLDLETLVVDVVTPEAFTKLIKKIDSLISSFDPQEVEKPADCVPAPRKRSEVEAGSSSTVFDGDTNCAAIRLDPEAPPSNFSSLAFLLGYNDDLGSPPAKEDFEYTKGVSKTKIKKLNLPEVFKLEKFQYSARGPNGTTIKKEGPFVWACISKVLSEKWNETCEQTGYYPFAITNGVKGYADPKTAGIAAYENGLSLHALGLAIDIDPQITGFSFDPRKAVYSVFTGAWNPEPFLANGDSILDELYKLGVYQKKGDKLLLNSYKDLNLSESRLTQDFDGAPDSYLKGTDTFSPRDSKYFKIMADAQGGLIVPYGANPVEWVIAFCEKTGMRWGNGTFLKRRWKGGKTWSDIEKKDISRLLETENVVDRIQNISWKDDTDSHAHFQYWNGKGIISWEEIEKYIEEEDL